jgi:hypothetical protein
MNDELIAKPMGAQRDAVAADLTSRKSRPDNRSVKGKIPGGAIL